MRRIFVVLAAVSVAFAPLLAGSEAAGAAAPEAKEKYWVEPMKKVHAKFKGEKGTFAHFGDSITITMAFWAPMKGGGKNMDKGAQAAHALVKGYMKDVCWRGWKSPRFGNNGGMTIRWAHANIDKWLKSMKPEVALIMFGTNDLGPLRVDEYEKKTRTVVQKCLDNGTVVILSTIPPRHGRDAKVKSFVEAVRKIAKELKVPLCDYYKAIIDRRPDDWSGRHPKFKTVPGGTYNVPTLVSRDGVHPSNPAKWSGDYSEEGLKNNGYVLRSYVVLHSYAEVLRDVIRQDGKPESVK